MYERSRTVVRCAVGQTEEFNVEVGLHQGSALSPFLFAIVMDQLSEEVRQESPWTMMFADDIVMCSESREQVEENLERWRFALERRGMKVSRSKTEYMCVNEREGSGTVRLQGEEVKKVQEFKYLGSTVQSNGECGNEEAAIDFKSLRAKFQEGSHVKDRPVVLDKPKHFPPIANRSNSLPMEEKNPVILPFNLRDGQKVLSGKRPGTVPSSFFPPDANGIGSGVSRRSLKDRHLPLVLPTSFSSSSNNPKHEASAPSKLVTSPIKCKKKAMPTPFKPAKFTKSIKDILENAEHPESSKSERYTVENGFSHHNGGSNPGSSCPSPEHPLTPSPTANEPSNMGSIPHVLSTLERAKKKFSPKNLLVYTRPKSFYSSKGLPESPPLPPPVEYENIHCDAESSSVRSEYQPTNSPTFTARSVPQSDDMNQRPVLHLNGDMKPVWPGVHLPPLVKALPDITSLGSMPKKPPRPPHVDLSAYRTHELENTTENASMIMAPGSEAVAAENLPTPPPPQFDAPHFLEFASSVLEALNTNEINLAALEMEPTDISAPPPRTDEVTDGSLHNNVNQKHGTGPLDLADINLQRSSLGHVADSQSVTACDAQLQEVVTSEISMTFPQKILTDSHMSSEVPYEPSITQRDDHYDVCDNVYEEVESISKFNFGQSSRKRKGAPKNPYAESPGKEETRKSVWHVTQGMNVTSEPSGVTPAVWDSGASVRKERWSPDHHDEKEARKREKQRLEREKKEQKEKEKKENEMKKKFKITGQEEPMYHARVLLASKLRKHDLQVKSGDTVSIIRTTNCPKGKWLARDSQNIYGYISVMNVELNMKEMLELGKRASQAIGKGHVEADTLSLSSRSSHYNPVLTSSFTDDSEEWTPDEETLSQLAESLCSNRAVSLPDVFNDVGSDHHPPSAGSVEDIPSQVNHEALQKLAVFFQNARDDLNTATEIPEPISTSINAPARRTSSVSQTSSCCLLLNSTPTTHEPSDKQYNFYNRLRDPVITQEITVLELF
ncbi:hypothetical protein QTP70_025756 [Hemibagrus guttatus]|uniref:ribonuclease H n=1 Tax=Hemibagrus guttatus TaxID=175788 RepID=A0AAE0R8I2_9TELE|nr:hypothetical protein QTP70_025756 [Hemibagrus guttatus]